MEFLDKFLRALNLLGPPSTTVIIYYKLTLRYESVGSKQD